MKILTVLCICFFGLVLWGNLKIDSASLRMLTAQVSMSESNEAKILLVEYLKEHPEPKNASFMSFQAKIDAILSQEIVDKATAGKGTKHSTVNIAETEDAALEVRLFYGLVVTFLFALTCIAMWVFYTKRARSN